MSKSIDNPILNAPYEQPDRYYEIGPQGPTGEIRDGRRPEPRPPPRRRQVASGWRVSRVTPISRKLLQHWADPNRENRVLFCQREAAETAIFLNEVAGRQGMTDWRERLEPENKAHNAGLPRVALKMATGSGKTVVMAMLIAWQTLNKAQSSRDARFSNRFLIVIVTPGITIRDRLRVLRPEGHCQLKVVWTFC